MSLCLKRHSSRLHFLRNGKVIYDLTTDQSISHVNTLQYTVLPSIWSERPLNQKWLKILDHLLPDVLRESVTAVARSDSRQTDSLPITSFQLRTTLDT